MIKNKVIEEEVKYEGKFINQILSTYIDNDGNERKWEKCSRKNKTKAVSIITWLKPSGRLLFIKQFRPPLDKFCIEFPAGLIDDKESIDQAVKRELKEETGYTISIKNDDNDIDFNTEEVSSSAGLTDEMIHIVQVSIDETRNINRKPKQKLEKDEFIEIFLVEKDEISKFIDTASQEGCIISSRVMMYLIGKDLL